MVVTPRLWKSVLKAVCNKNVTAWRCGVNIVFIRFGEFQKLNVDPFRSSSNKKRVKRWYAKIRTDSVVVSWKILGLYDQIIHNVHQLFDFDWFGYRSSFGGDSRESSSTERKCSKSVFDIYSRIPGFYNNGGYLHNCADFFQNNDIISKIKIWNQNQPGKFFFQYLLYFKFFHDFIWNFKILGWRVALRFLSLLAVFITYYLEIADCDLQNKVVDKLTNLDTDLNLTSLTSFR